jgi:hypothetical protein
VSQILLHDNITSEGKFPEKKNCHSVTSQEFALMFYVSLYFLDLRSETVTKNIWTKKILFFENPESIIELKMRK